VAHTVALDVIVAVSAEVPRVALDIVVAAVVAHTVWLSAG
jgi:hypothetical protein